MSTRLLKPAEAFGRLSVGNSKGYELLKSGELRSVKIGSARRIPEDAISEFIARAEAQPEAVGA
ncbi:excisionase family DNA-binding protein [Gordonia sp. 'Campus']|uniref:excisionase family DNA-binding protein n=1 Tax=Gordonia sp. 'Campus' TaxID=2915824 RepID=UPI001EE437EB|nr:excisionase family DNA-binding protein [Gordonia sp. 'Campus']